MKKEGSNPSSFSFFVPLPYSSFILPPSSFLEVVCGFWNCWLLPG